MGKLYLYMAWAIVLCLSCQTSAAILTFEDLNERQDISGTNRYDLFWEFGNQGAFSYTGSWGVPDYPSEPDENYYNSPHSGTKNISNSWGCTQISFRFPTNTFEHGAAVAGAYFAVQGYLSNWAQAVQAKGYKDGEEVWTSSLLYLNTSPQWLAMSEIPVDKVIIFTIPKEGKNYGYFGMDDLTLEVVPEPITLLLLTLGTTLLRRRK
jgi:hypothetical protein